MLLVSSFQAGYLIEHRSYLGVSRLKFLLILPDLMLSFGDFSSLHLNERLLRLAHVLTTVKFEAVLLSLLCGLLILALEFLQCLYLYSHFLNRL